MYFAKKRSWQILPDFRNLSSFRNGGIAETERLVWILSEDWVRIWIWEGEGVGAKIVPLGHVTIQGRPGYDLFQITKWAPDWHNFGHNWENKQFYEKSIFTRIVSMESRRASHIKERSLIWEACRFSHHFPSQQFNHLFTPIYRELHLPYMFMTQIKHRSGCRIMPGAAKHEREDHDR